jgi:hypothetical protein
LPNYSFATLTDAQNALLARLYDNGVAGQPTGQFWTAAECTVYLTEALRAWNAYTGFWRNQFAFDIDTVANNGSNWYDLTQQANSLRPYTVTDQYLTNVIEYHLLEPQTSLTGPAVWAGSNQFALSDIYQAVTRKQNECLSLTGCTVTQATIAAAIQRRTTLPDTTLDIRRVAWLPTSGLGYSAVPLRQSDNWELQAFNPTYNAAAQGWPRQWMQSSEPPPAFDVDIVPAVPGQYDVLTVNSGAVSSATAAQLMSVPDDWSFVPKWGALADLLSKEANAKDAARAKYCQARFTQDCKILANAPATLGLYLNGFPLFVDAVRNGDDFNPNWQGQSPKIPNSCYQAGLNLLGFPNPDQKYGILITVVQNAPVPVAPTDFIQVDRGDYDAIIDEAQHIAMFKVGGSEFLQSVSLHQNFLDQAAKQNSKLREYGQFSMDMQEISQRNEQSNPRMVTR